VRPDLATVWLKFRLGLKPDHFVAFFGRCLDAGSFSLLNPAGGLLLAFQGLTVIHPASTIEDSQ
jgi:hypothetical protein